MSVVLLEERVDTVESKSRLRPAQFPIRFRSPHDRPSHAELSTNLMATPALCYHHLPGRPAILSTASRQRTSEIGVESECGGWAGRKSGGEYKLAYGASLDVLCLAKASLGRRDAHPTHLQGLRVRRIATLTTPHKQRCSGQTAPISSWSCGSSLRLSWGGRCTSSWGWCLGSKVPRL
jgi:hypothetical protein